MEENKNVLTFTDDDGNNIDLEIVDSFDMDDIRFVALTEPETEENADSEAFVYIMQLISESEEEDILVQIEDQKVLDKAFDTFKSRCEDDFDFVDWKLA